MELTRLNEREKNQLIKRSQSMSTVLVAGYHGLINMSDITEKQLDTIDDCGRVQKMCNDNVNLVIKAKCTIQENTELKKVLLSALENCTEFNARKSALHLCKRVLGSFSLDETKDIKELLLECIEKVNITIATANSRQLSSEATLKMDRCNKMRIEYSMGYTLSTALNYRKPLAYSDHNRAIGFT